MNRRIPKPPVRALARASAGAARNWRDTSAGDCALCGWTVFVATGSWLRDALRCVRCRSIPRERALFATLNSVVPSWRSFRVHEFAPGGAASKALASAPSSSASHYPDEDLQALTFPDESFDLVVTQDVFEHVLDPDRGFSEVARVLRPGGMHVFTVPLHAGPTKMRVEPDGTRLLPAEYHADPAAPDKGALVVHEWGHDVVDRCVLPTEIIHFDDRRRGLRGAHLHVLVSRKPAG